MRTRGGILLVFFLLIFSSTSTFAVQPDESSQFFAEAFALAQQSCEQLGRNQVCYGHDLLEVEPRPEIQSLLFTAAGDVEELTRIKSLRLSGLDVSTGTWGIALLHLRANLPDSRAENVTMVAFGDVKLDDAVLPPTEAEIQVRTRQNVNVRQRPSASAGIIGTLAPQQTVTVVNRLADSSWLRVRLPGGDQTGWVLSELVSGGSDLSHLNVAAGDAPYLDQPMQAFYFSSGSNTISEVPANGLIIQTPEGVGEVNLLINEISIQLGSTVFFQAQPGQQMTIATLAGHADVRAYGIEQTAYAGTVVTIPITADLKPAGPPSPPQPYNQVQMEQLPVQILEHAVIPAPALTYEEIQARLAASPLGNGQNDSTADQDSSSPSVCPGSSCDAPGQGGSCPGNSCNAPGQGGSCPGNSCNAPGQNKDNKGKKDR